MSQMAPIAGGRDQPSTIWQQYWRNVLYFDKGQMEPLVALRNAIGVAAMLAFGVAAKMPVGGLAASIAALQVSYADASIGALHVSYSDARGPYVQRARRMLAAAILCSFAVIAGGLAVTRPMLAGIIIMVWGFLAGLAACFGETAESVGRISLVTLIVFGAQPLPTNQVVLAGLLALTGGLLQTLIALLLWPIRRYGPERRILSDMYLKLSQAAVAPTASESPPVSELMTAARTALASLSNDANLEAGRYWSLLNQAERIRITLITLGASRTMLVHDSYSQNALQAVNEFLSVSAKILAAVGQSLSRQEPATSAGEFLPMLEALADRAEQASPHTASPAAVITDARVQMDALIGQLHSAVRTTTAATSADLQAFANKDAMHPWKERFAGGLSKLRANLTVQSSAFRHAIRLTLCLAIGELVAHQLHDRHSYWLDMTIVLVLKQGFAATFSRGLLRIVGTFLGLIFATGLFHFLPPGIGLDILVVGVLVFVLRWAGAANYGVFTTTITALIVVMLSFTGVSPMQLIVERGEMTFLGGLIALGTYLIWPTWEHSQAYETLAQMLDAYRQYFAAVANACIKGHGASETELGPLRMAARLARSNMEASVDRLRAEPGSTPEEVSLVTALLANSHRFVRATMALEMISPKALPVRDGLQLFSSDVAKMLDTLISALRGNPGALRHVPDLCEDYRRLVKSAKLEVSRYALANEEADRITNSLNTLAEQVACWLKLREPACGASARRVG